MVWSKDIEFSVDQKLYLSRLTENVVPSNSRFGNLQVWLFSIYKFDFCIKSVSSNRSGNWASIFFFLRPRQRSPCDIWTQLTTADILKPFFVSFEYSRIIIIIYSAKYLSTFFSLLGGVKFFLASSGRRSRWSVKRTNPSFEDVVLF